MVAFKHNLTPKQRTTLVVIVRHANSHAGAVPHAAELAALLGGIKPDTAERRILTLYKNGYLVKRARGRYRLDQSAFCTTRNTAKLLMGFYELSRESVSTGEVERKVLIQQILPVFNDNAETVESTIDQCLKREYLKVNEARPTYLEGCDLLDIHLEYIQQLL